jgi:putative IMPACT (imprinted ancient) family translation regulator
VNGYEPKGTAGCPMRVMYSQQGYWTVLSIKVYKWEIGLGTIVERLLDQE